MKLKIIPHSEIDIAKWNGLISSSPKSTIFECDWYLNKLCTWDVVVRGDYEAGMALPTTTKFGQKLHYQPAFIQQCRWIGTKPSSTEITSLHHLLQKRYFKSHSNTNLFIVGGKERPNFVLKFDDSYENLLNNCGSSRKRNIKRAQKLDLTIIRELSTPDAVISIYREAYGELNSQLKDVDYQRFADLLLNAKERNALVYREVRQDDKLHAAGVFLNYNSRLHYVMGASNKMGRKSDALSLLIADLMKTYCNTDMELDFEGSAIPSVAHFYQSFGSVSEPFYENRFYGTSLFAKLIGMLKR